MTLSLENRAIVGTIITLANRLNFDVIAEGVETPEQLSLLQSLGCELAQGFLFSRPIPANEALLTLDAERFFQIINNSDLENRYSIDELPVSDANGEILRTRW